MPGAGIDAFRKRLAGDGNRVQWRSADIARLAEHFGVRDFATAPAIAPVPRSLELPTKVERAAEGKSTFTFTISTEAIDRMGDVIALAGWRLEHYKSNPVVLWAHDASLIPVGRATAIWSTGTALKSTVELATGISTYADRVRQMIEGGYLNATSVGFQPLKYAFSKDPARPYGIDFLEQELLEWSIVSVPANAECLIDGTATGKAAAARRRAREIEVMRLGGRLS